jgi:LysM repeat protein
MQSGKKLEEIATTHNVTADQLKQFMDTQRQNMLNTMKQKLAQEVTDGKITQTQMDQMIQRMTNPPVRAPHQPMVSAGLTTLFNMNATDIQAQLKAGKTLQQIATEHNISQDQLNQYFATDRQNMINKMKEELTKKVQEGKITQTQMDERIQKISSNPTKPFMGGFMKGGRHEFKNKANITTATPSTSHVNNIIKNWLSIVI